jgi:glycerophosphoryl diester phosphodiesterase
MKNIQSDDNFGPPWIVGHRGYRARYPENTLIGFEAAVAAGAAMIELDVMLSRDRRIIVIHDSVLDRTTNGRGNVADKSLAELKMLDAGEWFDPQFAGQQVPELREVLDLIGRGVFINIELKSNAYEPDHPADAIEKQVVELLTQKKLLESSLVSSFEAGFLEQIAAMPQAPAIAFISDAPADRDTIRMCRKLNIFSWHPNFRIVTQDQVDQVHSAGLKVFPFTVNNRADAIKMLDTGVDGIITDEPELAFKWIQDH